jgi:site-specific recombinase XerD
VSVSKTAQGTFKARIRDRSGKQVTKTFKFKADALAWERKQLQDRESSTGGQRAHSKDTVAQWANNWLALSRHLAPGTIDTYQRDLDRYILPRIGDYRMNDVTSDDIDLMLTQLLEKGLAPSSVHRHYRTVRTMFQIAVKRGKLPANPADVVNPPRIPQREMRFLTVDQLELLADTISDRFRSWVLVAGYGGLRWAESMAVRPQDVTGNTIDVNAQLQMEGGEWRRLPLKTKASRRKVQLPPSVGAELEYHIDRYAADTVFVNQHGNPIKRDSFTGNVFKPALVKAGLDRQLRIHDLRHSAVAIAIEADGHPKVIQRRMGHASIAVTLDTYGHLMPEMDSSLALDIDNLRTNRFDL